MKTIPTNILPNQTQVQINSSGMKHHNQNGRIVWSKQNGSPNTNQRIYMIYFSPGNSEIYCRSEIVAH